MTRVSGHTGNKETCKNPLSISPNLASFFTQRMPILRKELCQYKSPNGYKNGASLRSACTTILRLNELVLLKAFAKHGARDFSEKYWLRLTHEGSSKTRVEYCEDSKHSLTCGIPIDPQWMVVEFLTFGKSIFFRGCFFQHSIYSGEWTDSGWTWKRQRTADCLLHTT